MIRKNLAVTMVVMLMVTLICMRPASSKDYVALLICGSPADSLDSQYQILWNNGIEKEKGYDEFWNDTYLMWELLYDYGYTDENIHVLYADGESFPTIDRYRADPDSFPDGIVDTSAYYADVVDIFTDLAQGDTARGIEAMTDDDFFFCWTFGDGGPFIVPSDPIVSLCMADTGVVMWDTTFADYVDSIHCERRVFWMQQCRSGGFKDNLENEKTVFLSACEYNQLAWPTDDIAAFDCTTHVEENDIWAHGLQICHHGEFNFHVLNAVRGVTPKDSLVDADVDGDGFISMEEAMEWEFDHDSGYLCDTAPYGYQVTPQYSDLGDIGSETFLDATPIVSGHINSNTTWENDKTIIVRGDVVVDSGVTLIIDAGTTVVFLANFDSEKGGEDTTKCELIVYGYLNAWGTSNDSIKFTSNAATPIAGNWYGIVFKDSISNGSRIGYSQIKYGHKGIYCQGCSIAVRSTKLSQCDYGAYVDTSGTELFLYEVTSENCSYGLRVQNGAVCSQNCDFSNNGVGIGCDASAHYYPSSNRYPDFKNCEVHNNSWGIYLVDSSPIINHCDIDSNSSWGIACYDDSDPIIGKDTLTYNGSNSKYWKGPGPPPQEPHTGGLYCGGTSSPVVCEGATLPGSHYERGRNIIKNNTGDGVSCSGESSPKLGQGWGIQEGRNHLGDNSSYDVYNSTESIVKAEYNWWGESPPDTNEIVGLVDYTPWLTDSTQGGKGFGGDARIALLEQRVRGSMMKRASRGQEQGWATPEEYNELGTYVTGRVATRPELFPILTICAPARRIRCWQTWLLI